MPSISFTFMLLLLTINPLPLKALYIRLEKYFSLTVFKSVKRSEFLCCYVAKKRSTVKQLSQFSVIIC